MRADSTHSFGSVQYNFIFTLNCLWPLPLLHPTGPNALLTSVAGWWWRKSEGEDAAKIIKYPRVFCVAASVTTSCVSGQLSPVAAAAGWLTQTNWSLLPLSLRVPAGSVVDAATRLIKLQKMCWATNQKFCKTSSHMYVIQTRLPESSTLLIWICYLDLA